MSHGTLKHQAKHFFYAAGWKKFEPLWNVVIRARQLGCMTPLLEAVLAKVSQSEPQTSPSSGPLGGAPGADSYAARRDLPA